MPRKRTQTQTQTQTLVALQFAGNWNNNNSNPELNYSLMFGKRNPTPNFDSLSTGIGQDASCCDCSFRLGNLKHLRRGMVGSRHVEPYEREIVADDCSLMGRRRSLSPMKAIRN